MWTKVYQDVRLPRAQKAQITSRQAGDVYEMQGPDFAGLTYDQCLPIVKEKLQHRMRWVWGGDIDAEYEAVVLHSRLVEGPGGQAMAEDEGLVNGARQNGVKVNGVH